MDSPNAYKFHLMHLNLEYSDRLKTANRSWYKRDLYETYSWERNNLDNDLKRAKAVLLRVAFQKRLSAMTRSGNINLKKIRQMIKTKQKFFFFKSFRCLRIGLRKHFLIQFKAP